MSNPLLLRMLALAQRIESDREAIWEWFFRTPISPYGKTAYELGLEDRGEVVIAFLEKVLNEATRAPDVDSTTHDVIPA